MDSIRASEAPDPGSIPGEATKSQNQRALKRTKPTPNSILVWFFYFFSRFNFRWSPLICLHFRLHLCKNSHLYEMKIPRIAILLNWRNKVNVSGMYYVFIRIKINDTARYFKIDIS